MVLIVVALSFDILWTSGRIPIAEIAVFMFALTLWAYGNLKGGIVEYPFKLGSFNLALILMTNFYVISIFGDLTILALWEVFVGAVMMPLLCLTVSAILASYLKDNLDQSITRGILIGGTLGYIISITALVLTS